jgi:O-antigen/teichoic acid export membrane protein
MTLGRNLLAGFANSVSTTLIGLIVVPLYIRYLGVEAYGLIGFFVTMQAFLQVLDLGLAPTLNREVARSRAGGDVSGAGRLLHTLAVVYWATAVVIAVGLALAAPTIAHRWLQSRQLAADTVANAVVLMGLIIACRWPTAIYLGALLGAERLTIASGLSIANAVIAGFGSVAVIAFVSPSVHAFFLWQAVSGLAYAVAMRWAAWHVIGRGRELRFDPGELRRLWRFSVGMGGITVVGLVVAQIDKVLLSRLLGLGDFGRYMVASTVAGGLYVLVLPVFNGVFPRFSNLVARGDANGLAALYRTATRLLGAALFPLAMLLVVSGEDLVRIWTRDAALAETVAPILALLAAGTALHGAMYLPYALQLAHGKTRLALQIALIVAALTVPAMLTLALRYGAVGGGMAWLLVHVAYMTLGTWMTHRRLLRGMGIDWLLREVGIPLGISAAVGLVAHQVLRASGWTPLARAGCGVAFALLASGLSFAASPQLSTAVLENLGLRKPPQPPSGAPLPRTGGT